MTTEIEQRQAVIAEALSWCGTPYMHRARVKGAGVDCIQLLIAVYSACGVMEEVDPGDYPPDWMLHRSEELYLAGVMKYAHRVDQPQPGDVAVWRFGRCVSHGAIVVEWPTVIHAFRQERMCVQGRVDGGDFEKRPPLFFSLWGDC